MQAEFEHTAGSQLQKYRTSDPHSEDHSRAFRIVKYGPNFSAVPHDGRV